MTSIPMDEKKDKKIKFIAAGVIASFALFVSSASAANLITINQGFDDGALIGWSANSTSISASSEKSYSLSYSCKFKDPTSAFPGRELESNQGSISSDGKYYIKISSPDANAFTLSAWFHVVNEGKGVITDSYLRIYVKWYDAAYNKLDEESGYTTGEHIANFDSWYQIETPLIDAPANAVYAKVAIDCKETPNNNNDIYVDDVKFVSSPMPEYLKRIGLKIFGVEHETDKEIRVFFPLSTPANKPKKCKIVFNMTSAPVTEVRVNLLVYDIKGRLVDTIVRGEEFTSRHYAYVWDGRDVNQQYLPCGMYIVSLEAADQETGNVIREQKVVAIGRKL